MEMEIKPVPKEAKILTKLTGTGFPCFITYSHNNTIITGKHNNTIITGQYEKDSPHYRCYRWDLKTKKGIFLFSCSLYPELTANPNKQTITIQENEHITIYDIIKQTPIKKTNLESVITPEHCLYSNNTSLMITRSLRDNKLTIETFNLNNKSQKSYHLEQHINGNIATHNPPPQELTLFDNLHQKTIMIGLNNDKAFVKKEFKAPDCISIAYYSPDHSLIALAPSRLYETKGFYILDLKTYSFSELLSNNEDISAMKFHPTSCILATFSYSTLMLHFWNAKALKHIESIFLNIIYDELSPGDVNHYIDFAPNGKSIVITLVNKCLEVEVPSEVLYEVNKKRIFTYWILKNYQQQHTSVIPNEIIQLLNTY